MYEPIAHALLNRILDELKTRVDGADLRHFHTRLGANFYAIYSLFYLLYGSREDFEEQMIALVKVMAEQYIARSDELKLLDRERESDHEWFLRQEWVGMALYTDGFAGDLDGLRAHLGYLQELGVNLVHVMPILKCPPGASDGGYAVSDFRDVDERIGSLEDLEELADEMRPREMLLVLDVVVNHTSEEHEWARRARAGEARYQDYFYIYDDRKVPDLFEQTLPEVFPETSPGNFTYDDELEKWVMTVFNHYQWDLNYRNPAVFIEMLEIILYWGNKGADILRLDAVAFLWKKMGTTSQNEREAHLILQLMKDCCQVTAPGVLFIAEAIVAPVEITKYFGEDAVIAKECEIAYNATLMALLWNTVATKSSNLLNRGVQSLPAKLDRATWLNYVRCHDDIGLGIDDRDIQLAGYEPRAHRKFLVDYFTGTYDSSPASGQPFARNEKTGDARISGSLASLAGLESALQSGDETAIDQSIDTILLLHGVIMSFGGIPLLYYGDELGTLNDYSYLDDDHKAADNRWIHRPRLDWTLADERRRHGTPQQRIFDGLRRMIGARKTIPAFADFNNREVLETDNPHLFVYTRTNPYKHSEIVLVVANFDIDAQDLDMDALGNRATFGYGHLRDLCSGESLSLTDNKLVIPPLSFYWLSE